MKNNIHITPKDNSFVIESEYDNVLSTLAICWDYQLALKLKKTIERYMKKNIIDKS